MSPPNSLLITLLSFNTRGLKANIDYINYITNNFDSPLICCLSEHWLHHFDLNFLCNIAGSPKFTAESVVEQDVYVPNLLRGKSGVAILWSTSLDQYISPIPHPRSDRIIGICFKATPCDIVLFSVYLPCRTGCTDHFKEVLDTLDSTLTFLAGSIVLFVGDFNADPGSAANPQNIYPPNEQGLILARYLAQWDCVSSSPLSQSIHIYLHQ